MPRWVNRCARCVPRFCSFRRLGDVRLSRSSQGHHAKVKRESDPTYHLCKVKYGLVELLSALCADLRRPHATESAATSRSGHRYTLFLFLAPQGREDPLSAGTGGRVWVRPARGAYSGRCARAGASSPDRLERSAVGLVPGANDDQEWRRLWAHGYWLM